MKKAVMIILLAILVIGVLGCKGEDSTGVVIPSKPGSTGTTVPAETETPSDSGSQPATDSGTTTTPSGAKTKIDLIVADAYFNPAFPAPNEDVELKMIFKNQGTEDSGVFDYNIKIYKDGSVWKEEKFTTTSGLARGAQDKLTQEYTFSSTGTYYAEIFVDPNDKISEITETNNYMRSKSDMMVSTPVQKTTSTNDDDNTN
ncbi:MAG: hypothetical protein KKE20_05625 [Nanoarchaeota archaeon]|nr:hypothetical protein [Nanoarchaeota archaeon]